MKKIIISLIFSLISFCSLFSQNDLGPALSSQLFSRINFNPAGMGNDRDINIFNMNRMQWAGFEGGPQYSILNIHYFNDRMNSGFGGAFSYDQLGIANRALNAKLAYSYSIDLSEKALISFGASGGVLRKGNDFSLLSGHIYDKADISIIPQVAESKMNPDFDFGVEFSTPTLLIGASINHLGMMDPATILTPTQTYYGYVRGMFPVSQDIVLAPSVLYMNSGLINVIDINTVAFFNEAFWGGLSLRLGAGLAAMAGLEWNFLRVGYSYELSFGSATINNNTHELMLSFKINTERKAAPAPDKKKKR